VTPTLWHVSDRRGIDRFEPRSIDTDGSTEPLVRAIDEEHVPAYWFPRDLPRGTFWAAAGTTGEDVDAFLASDRARRVHAIQRDWLAELRGARLVAYRLPGETFELYDETAGYYVSREAVAPVEVVELAGLEARHAAAGIELRVVDDLDELWQRVIRSTLVFSGIRLRNLARRPGRRT
jgi:hypothetical protein